jgi:hypothetical protein
MQPEVRWEEIISSLVPDILAASFIVSGNPGNWLKSWFYRNRHANNHLPGNRLSRIVIGLTSNRE